MSDESKTKPAAPLSAWTISIALAALWLLSAVPAGKAQVSPDEVVSPELKAAEAKYFPQLKQLNQSIAKMKFPFPFFLSRYVGVDPAKQAGIDSRGLEFVRFHDRVVMKVTGNYNAAFNAGRVTQNERASRTFHDVVFPIVQLVADQLPRDATYDAIGFEYSYHLRTGSNSLDYEAKEILVVVLDKNDAFALSQAANDIDRQEIINRSEVYLNGEEYGLSLSGQDPLVVGELDRSRMKKIVETPSVGDVAHGSPGQTINTSSSLGKPAPPPRATTSESPIASPGIAVPSRRESDSAGANAVVAQSDADKLQALYQTQLDALEKEGAAKYHFVDYAPPSFVLFQNRVALQITLRNPALFDIEKSSIYKRAAQSFDLFLAPQLKDLLEKSPSKAEFACFDFTVVNQLAAEPHASSEAIEFVIPARILRQFVEAEITNQQLVDQSSVLVNGVRIALNLQMVE